MLKNLDHIAIAVNSIQEKQQVLEHLFQFSCIAEEKVESEKVRIAYLKSPSAKIELIEPMEGNQSLTKFLSKKGEGIHHLCYIVEDMEEAIKELKSRGALFILPEIRTGSHGAKVAFLHPKSTGGILMELKEEKNESKNKNS